MMDLFCYCYNVFFILLFMAVVTTCYTAYGITGKRIFRLFGVLFCTYICESIYVAIVELFLLFQFEAIYFYFDRLHTLFMVLFSVMEAYVIWKMICEMCNQKKRKPVYMIAFLIALAAAELFLQGSSGRFLAMSTFNFTLLGLCGMYFFLLRRAEPDACKKALPYRTPIQTTCIFSILAILENAIYIFLAQDFIDRMLPFYGNKINFFDDLFCVILSVWLLLFSRKEQEKFMVQKMEETLQHRMNEFQAIEQERVKEVGSKQLMDFCVHYGLTERETEILRLILEGKSNKELSDELFITVGTVKAHVHSIFSKLEVARRSQLMDRFINHGLNE